MFRLFLAVVLLFASSKGHECIHDKLDIKPTKSFVNYDNHPFEKDASDASGRRRLASSPIRVRADYHVLQQDWASQPTQIAEVQQAIGAVIRYLERVLKVVPVSGNLLIERRCQYFYTSNGQRYCSQAQPDNQATCQSCGGNPMVYFPSSILDGLQLYNNQLQPTTLFPKGSGLAATDIVIYVTAKNCNCGGSTLAWAGACKTDQYGRPVAGVVNICKIDTTQWEDTVNTLLHEISHILFMSSNLFADYRDASGAVRPNTIQVSANRQYLTTPAVKSEARSHLACTSLPGAPIENGGGSGSAGSHWDQQFFYTEIMCPQSSSNRQAFSRLSFAALEDSGWYQINMNDADPLAFGENTGCSFINDPAQSANCAGFPNFYCTVGGTACSYDGRTAGGCGGANSYNPCNVIQPYSNVAPCDISTSTQLGAQGGLTSRCANVKASWGNTAGCYPTQCNGYNSGTNKYSSITMTVSGQSITCQRADIGQVRTLSVGDFTCPNFDMFCVGTSPFQCNHGHLVGNSCFCQVGYTAGDCNAKDFGSGQTPKPTPQTAQTPKPTQVVVNTPRPTNPPLPTPQPTSGGGGTPSCTGLTATIGTYFKAASPLVTKQQYLTALRRYQPCIYPSTKDDVVDIPYPNFPAYRKVTLVFTTSVAVYNIGGWRLGIEQQLQAMGIPLPSAAGAATPPASASTSSATEQFPSTQSNSGKMNSGEIAGTVIGAFLGGMLCCGLFGMCWYMAKGRREMKGQYLLMDDDQQARTIS